MTDFNGRPILVTGATGGIGGATVRQLTEAGADVIASGRNQEALDEFAAQTGCAPWPSSSPPRTASAARSPIWTCGAW